MKKVAALLALALASFALVACGGDDDDGTTTTTTPPAENGAQTDGAARDGAAGGGSTVQLEADPDGGLAYTADEVTAKAGDVTIDFSNPQSLVHDVVVEDAAGEEVGRTELITDGAESVTLKGLKPADYTFYCSVPGHREAGMEGTLAVE
jgi:plastocyanin